MSPNRSSIIRILSFLVFSTTVFTCLTASGSSNSSIQTFATSLKRPEEELQRPVLETGPPIEKQLAGGNSDSYTINLKARAPRVVASLWQVEDRATAEFMTRFYRSMLRDGLRPAAALRSAQLAMSQDKHWHSPYYWSAFTLQGEWK